MTHPTHEDWMSFLYDEDSPERHGELERHLHSCAACAARVNAWKLGARALDDWTLPAARPAPVHQPRWKWAAAAALILGAGIAMGRLAIPRGPEPNALRVMLTRELDQKVQSARADLLAELRQSEGGTVSKLLAAARETAGTETQRWLAAYARDQEEQHLGDKESIVATLREFDAKYAAGLALLRKELETVAVNTEDSFTETEQKLGQLASFKQPADLPSK